MHVWSAFFCIFIVLHVDKLRKVFVSVSVVTYRKISFCLSLGCERADSRKELEVTGLDHRIGLRVSTLRLNGRDEVEWAQRNYPNVSLSNGRLHFQLPEEKSAAQAALVQFRRVGKKQ